jgi:predicted ATP-grasp superfamily ATP-dependent carboligase
MNRKWTGSMREPRLEIVGVTSKTLTTTWPRAGGKESADALVLDAQFRQSLAVMRSLSRSGVRVGAVACKSEARWAPALKSRWCQQQSIVPDFEDNPKAFGDAVLTLLDEQPARLIVPSHDGTIETLRARRAEIERRTFFPLASEAALDIAVSKPRALALATELGIAVPKSVVVATLSDVRAAINEVGCPAVIKPVQSWGEMDGVGGRQGAESAMTLDEAVRLVDKMLGFGLHAVVQEWLPGRRDAVSLFCTSGRIWARFAQTSYREFPPLGGSSVLCESIPLLDDLVQPADALVRAADLDGCSMVEFRRDRAGRPVLMEINARLAGSVGLAISAGVDFPRYLYDWAVRKQLEETSRYVIGRRARWISGDVWYLKDVMTGAGRTDTPTLGRAIGTFFADFVRRPGALDGFALSDPLPTLYELQQGLVHPVLRRTYRSGIGLFNGISRGSHEPKQS